MNLNPFQQEILQAVAADIPIKQIADNYNQPYHAINGTLERLRKKYNCKTNVSLVLLGLLSEQIEWPEVYAIKKRA